MAPFANAAASKADLDRRGNDGIALTSFRVIRNPGNPTYIKYKWSSHKRSPHKFTVWLRNVKTQEHYKADETVWTSAGSGRVGLNSLNKQAGVWQLVLTKHNDYNDVYARSETFHTWSTDFP
ncbi:hypothetical protein FRB90_012588 [Tulasnella sp. 427]|nr:hypothetical protein FRB90_012588 [Tulasnella sp. 427]